MSIRIESEETKPVYQPTVTEEVCDWVNLHMHFNYLFTFYYKLIIIYYISASERRKNMSGSNLKLVRFVAEGVTTLALN